MRLARWDQLKEFVNKSSVVLEVVDARNPWLTRSRGLERLVTTRGKPLIVVINKCDLIPREVAEKWKRVFKLEGLYSVYVSTRERHGTRILRSSVKKLAGQHDPIIAVVVGFPKTGKSSVINVLKGRHSAMTSAVPGTPGYTRGIQLFKVEPGFYMYDTPGVVPVEGGPLESVIRGAPPEGIKEPIEPALRLLELALKHNPNSVVEAYGIRDRDPYNILVELARRRGWFYKGGKEPVVEEAARTVIRDYHKAKLRFHITPESIGLSV